MGQGIAGCCSRDKRERGTNTCLNADSSTGLLDPTMTSQGDDFPHAGLPLLCLGECPPRPSRLPITSESHPGSYERKDLADRPDANIALHCADLYAAVFFPRHSFSLPWSLLPIVSQVLSKRRPRSFPLCPRSQTDAETETAITSIHSVCSDHTS